MSFSSSGCSRHFVLDDVREPNLFRDQFPYTEVPRIRFDGLTPEVSPADEIWITDTTFRDGQQARPPYVPEQIIELYKLLHQLGGPRGVIRQSEFFLYSRRDQAAVEGCLALGYRYPEVTGWIRANAEDFQLVKSLGLRETGILTSVSDYHIFLKLKKTRQKAMDDYLGLVKTALSEGIIPRCHFEDVTRADLYGFCLPFAEQLMELSREAKLPVKIRLCDTMGYGVTYPGAALPRSVPRIVSAFHRELGIPSALLEWHGHNDFHKVLSNAATAWLYGCSALNASLLGYGERTGNPPLEGALIEWLGLQGEPCGVDTRIITRIAEYFREVIKAPIPDNYPLVGAECNTTRVGIHADGLLKNPEIYSIFDTERLLDRPLQVMVSDKSGLAGIAEWLNDFIKRLPGKHEAISKRHPGVRLIHEWVMAEYAQGRTSSISNEEMVAQAKHYLPSLFQSDFQRVKQAAIATAQRFLAAVRNAPELKTLSPRQMAPYLKNLVKSEPSIQFLAVTNRSGHHVVQVLTQRGEKKLFRPLLTANLSDREWFQTVMETGKPYWTDLYFSHYTGRLILTFAEPLRDAAGQLIAVLNVDFKFDDLSKLVNDLPTGNENAVLQPC